MSDVLLPEEAVQGGDVLSGHLRRDAYRTALGQGAEQEHLRSHK